MALASDSSAPPSLYATPALPEIDQEQARETAKELIFNILQLNEEYPDRKISIVVEFVAGRVTDTVLRLIHM